MINNELRVLGCCEVCIHDDDRTRGPDVGESGSKSNQLAKSSGPWPARPSMTKTKVAIMANREC